MKYYSQTYVDTAIERRGIEPFYYRVARYAQILLKVLKSYFHILKLNSIKLWLCLQVVVPCYLMQKRGLPQRFLKPFFLPQDFEGKTSQQLFDMITEKAGFEYIMVKN